MTDREPQHGELFVIEWSSGRQSIMQAAARQHMGVDGQPFTGWWTRNLAASQFSHAEKLAMIHCDDSEIASAAMSLWYTDGPRQIDGFRKAIVGRIIGVLAPAALVHAFIELQRIKLARRVIRVSKTIVDVIAPTHITRP